MTAITEEDLINRGFYLANKIEDTGIQEYRLEINKALITYKFDVGYIYGNKLGYKELHIIGRGESKAFDHPITDLEEIDSIIKNVLESL